MYEEKLFSFYKQPFTNDDILHRKFTRLPHLAGTAQNLRYAEQIREEWLEFGLDSVELVPYDVLLSYPNKSQPNYISVVDQLGDEVPCMHTKVNKVVHEM